MGDISQVPARINLKFYRQDGLNPVQIQLGIILTGYTFVAYIVPKTGNPVALTVANTNLAAGIITISLTPAHAAALPLGKSSTWYLQWTDPDTEKLTIFAGVVEIL